MQIERPKEQPVVVVKWYDYTKWVLDRVDGFPKNQRFVLGTRLADAAVLVMELLGEANRKIEVVRWLVRLVSDRNLISKRQFLHSCRGLEECGRMVGGWHRSL